MIYGLSVTNDSFPDWYDLTADQNTYALIRVDGLNPPPVTINTSTGGTIDGTFYNSSRVQQRNIVLTILPRGNVEMNRQRLYGLFPINQRVTMRFFNQNRRVEISGYVEAIEGSLFDNPQTFNISIICPRPFFEDIDYTQITLSTSSTLLQNTGDVENGLDIFITFPSLSGDVVRGLSIDNISTGDHLKFDMAFTSNDYVTISTLQGQLTAYVMRGSIRIPLYNYITSDSKWLKMRKGNNYLTFSTTNSMEQYCDIEINYKNSFVGV